MKIGDFIKFGRENNLDRKGLKKRIRDLKKSNYGDGWQSVNEQFYEHIGILEQRPLLHKNFLEYLKKINGAETILEIGCGMGIYPIKFKNIFENKDYTGIDIGEPAINFCKNNSKFNFICGDLLETKLNKKFDLIFSHAVIDHVYDIDRYLTKIIELSKKFVYISTYRGYFPDLKEHKRTWDNENGYYYNDLSVQKVKERLLACGLIEDEFLIREQKDGMKLNQPYSIGLTGVETIIEIERKDSN